MELPVLRGRRGILLSVAAVAVLVAIGWSILARAPGFDANREYLIGSDNTYPYHSVDESGRASGFAVEMLNEAATRLGIRLRWLRTRRRAIEALQAGEVDLWPALSVESKRFEPSLNLSEPWINNDFALVAIREEFRNLHDAVKIRRIAFREQSNTRRLATEKFPRAELIPVIDRADAVSNVCTGEADGAVLELRSAYAFMARPPESCNGHPPCFVGLTFQGEALSAAGRDGMGPVVDALRAEIDRMSADGTTERILLPWSYFQSNEVQSMFRAKEVARSLLLTRMVFGASLLFAASLGALCLLLRRTAVARDRANRENWAKTLFMQKMSHELRTPLNGIVAGAELLDCTALEYEQKEYVGIIRSSGATLLRLVQDLLDLSKAATDKLPIRSEAFVLEAWLRKALAPYVSQGHVQGLQIIVSGLAGLYPGPLTGDPVRLGQVLGNLVSNALRYTERGSVRIEASSRQEGEVVWLEIAVADTGRGIAAERLPGIFDGAASPERFDHPERGLGLGLSIAADLVRLMNGTIEASSEVGQGATFRFRVPLQVVADRPAAARSL